MKMKNESAMLIDRYFTSDHLVLHSELRQIR